MDMPAPPPANRIRHTIRVDGCSRTFTCAGDERLLVAMERAKAADFGRRWEAAVDVGCRRGGCGVCRVRVLTGRYRTTPMSAAHVSEDERAAGYALACCVYPDSDLVVAPARKPRPAAAAENQTEPSELTS